MNYRTLTFRSAILGICTLIIIGCTLSVVRLV